MAHAEPPSRSRIAWPHREAPEPPTLPVVVADKRKTHRRQWAAIVALYLVVALNTYLVLLDHQYVVGRGQYRDAEAARIEQQNTERLRQFACGLLDGLPQGPVLDPLRIEYGCELGNGIPLEELAPEAQAQLRQFAEPPPTVVTRDPDRQQAAPSYDRKAPREDPAEPTSVPTASASPSTAPTSPAPPSVMPSPSPAPLVDVSPLTDTVCDLTGICL